MIADNDNRPAADGESSDDKLDAFSDMHVAASESMNDELRSDGPPCAGIRQIPLLNPGECYEALPGESHPRSSTSSGMFAEAIIGTIKAVDL